jgi:hypothetical protein
MEVTLRKGDCAPAEAAAATSVRFVADGGVMALEIVDADGTNQVVKLREPLMLASPGT